MANYKLSGGDALARAVEKLYETGVPNIILSR